VIPGPSQVPAVHPLLRQRSRTEASVTLTHEVTVQLTLTEQDAQTLRNMLHDYLPALGREAARTNLGADDLRAELGRREALRNRLLVELGANPLPQKTGNPATGCFGSETVAKGTCAAQTCGSAVGLRATDIAAYKRVLRETAARLGGQVTVLEQEARQPTGTALGTAEEATALALLQTEEGSLAEVNAALDRIDRGTFGRCEGCGKPVTKSRLDALPHARYCIVCARHPHAAG
jgi:DnaK suppressor protein